MDVQTTRSITNKPLRVMDVRAFDATRWWVQFSDGSCKLFTAEQWRAYPSSPALMTHETSVAGRGYGNAQGSPLRQTRF